MKRRQHRDNPESDRARPFTPDRLRNDKALWKDHDQPDAPRDNRPDPEKDYPDARESAPRKR